MKHGRLKCTWSGGKEFPGAGVNDLYTHRAWRSVMLVIITGIIYGFDLDESRGY